MKNQLTLAGVAVVAAGAAWGLTQTVQSPLMTPAQAAPQSGSKLKVGDTVSAFEVQDVTGPNKGKTLCYVCQNAYKPVTLTFARTLTPQLGSLIKALDKGTPAGDKASTFVVFTPKNAGALMPQLKRFAAQNKIGIPLTIADSLAEVKQSYGVTPSDKMPVTVLVYNERVIKHKWDLTKITPQTVKTVVTASQKNRQA